MPSISAMMKAPTPMIGGMICPPVEATASTAPASSGAYPIFFIIGIVITPVVATFATADPEIMPIRPEERTAAFAGPPEDLLEAFMPMSISSWPPPISEKKAPNTMK